MLFAGSLLLCVFSDLAILPAVVFLRAPVYKSQMSAAVEARLLDFLTTNILRLWKDGIL